MIRVRFRANPEDYRPVTWPIKHPYWCSGYGADYSMLIAYADTVDDIMTLWPEATDLDILETDAEYQFSGRFPEPDWFKEQQKELHNG